MLVHRAAEVFQAQHHLVRLAGHAKNGADLLPQRRDCSGPDVTLELQDINPAPGVGAVGVFLKFPLLLLLLQFRLAFRLAEQRVAQLLAQVPVFIVELLDLEAPGGWPFAGQAHRQRDDGRHRGNHGDCLGEKEAVVEQELDHRGQRQLAGRPALLRSSARSAR